MGFICSFAHRTFFFFLPLNISSSSVFTENNSTCDQRAASHTVAPVILDEKKQVRDTCPRIFFFTYFSSRSKLHFCFFKLKMSWHGWGRGRWYIKDIKRCYFCPFLFDLHKQFRNKKFVFVLWLTDVWPLRPHVVSTCREKVSCRSVSVSPAEDSRISLERRIRLEPWGGDRRKRRRMREGDKRQKTECREKLSSATRREESAGTKEDEREDETDWQEEQRGETVSLNYTTETKDLLV